MRPHLIPPPHPHLYLVRGLPGSGKTTLARTLQLMPNTAVRAADDWFDLYNNGCFDPTKLSTAHAWCLDETCRLLDEGWNVVVHNTFTSNKELEPYMQACRDRNMLFTSIVVENRHGNTSVHSVPESTLIKMRRRLEGSVHL